MTQDEYAKKYPEATKVASPEARKKQAFLQELFEWFDEQKDEIGIAELYMYPRLGDNTHHMIRDATARAKFIARYCGVDYEKYQTEREAMYQELREEANR